MLDFLRRLSAIRPVSSWRPVIFGMVVAVSALLNAVQHLRTPADWWFEDDPGCYVTASRAADLAKIFVDPKASKGGVGPNEMAPVLLASFWVDHAIAPRDPGVSYWHSAWIYALAAVMVFVVIRRLSGQDVLACLAALTWLFLPTTEAIVEFLSARHYMYGMVFSLFAFEAAERAVAHQGAQRWLWFIGFAVCLWFGLISKELFPPVMLTIVFLRFAQRRLWAGCVLSIGLAVGYAAYRFWMTDPALEYRGIPWLGLHDFAIFLSRLPYMFAGGWLGYVVLAAALIAQVWMIWRMPASRVPAVIFVLGMIAAVGTVIPVASAVSSSWQTLGTWYRTPFAINTLFLIGATLAWSLLPWRKLALALSLGTLAVSIHGGHLLALQWDVMKERLQSEAEFVLTNPGKIYFSWTEAYWFLSGVKRLYPEVEAATVVNRWPSVPWKSRKILLADEGVWTLVNGRIQHVDRAGMQSILQAIP